MFAERIADDVIGLVHVENAALGEVRERAEAGDAAIENGKARRLEIIFGRQEPERAGVGETDLIEQVRAQDPGVGDVSAAGFVVEVGVEPGERVELREGQHECSGALKVANRESVTGAEVLIAADEEFDSYWWGWRNFG